MCLWTPSDGLTAHLFLPSVQVQSDFCRSCRTGAFISIPDDNMDTEEKSVKERQSKRKTWKRAVDYGFNLLGWVVGLGNVWRFPYLCFKNGGGAFLVAYILFLLVMIFPLTVLEAAVGQFIGRSTVKCWKIIPLMAGIGYFGFVIPMLGSMYVPAVMAWIIRWIVASFSKTLPWASCGNSWNTQRCVDLHGRIETMNASSALLLNNQTTVSSVEEYWQQKILGVSSGLTDAGNMQWHLLACLTVYYIFTYFCLWKGIGWTSKIVYVTATLPVVLLIVMAGKALTLDGSSQGLSFFLTPNATKLLEIDVWHDAASQVMFTIGTGGGMLTTLSGYNKFHHNFFRDLVVVIILNTCVSLLAGLAIFPVLGYLSLSSNTTVAEVVQSGPGLVFTVYPAALALLPLPQLWSVLFFVMLFFMGADTTFVILEAWVACLEDIFPKLFRWRRELIVAVALLGFYIMGLPMMMGNGIYILEIFDRYAVTGWCMLFVTISEFVTIGWMYGPNRLCRNMEEMLGYRLPRLWIKLTTRYIGPCFATIVLVLSVAGYKSLVTSEAYPPWADVLGWLLTLSSVLWIPGTAVYAVYKAEGATFREKFKKSITPVVPRRDGNDEEIMELDSKRGLQ